MASGAGGSVSIDALAAACLRVMEQARLPGAVRGCGLIINGPAPEVCGVLFIRSAAALDY
jgi:hypothetical protein